MGEVAGLVVVVAWLLARAQDWFDSFGREIDAYAERNGLREVDRG